MGEISLQVGHDNYSLGSRAGWEALFATISYRLEPDGWATRFPILLKKLYPGDLTHQDAASAQQELVTIESELRQLAVDKAVTDMDRLKPLDASIPVNQQAKNLRELFCDSTGAVLLDRIRDMLSQSHAQRVDVTKKLTLAPMAAEERWKALGGGLFLLVGGIVAVAYNWHLAKSDGSYYPKLAVLGPLLAVMGIAFLIKPDLRDKTWKKRDRTAAENKKFQLIWIVIVTVGVGLGIANWYFLHNGGP